MMDRETEENVLMMKVGEGALRNFFLFRIPGLLFTSGKAELRGEITLKLGWNSSKTWPAAVTFLVVPM